MTVNDILADAKEIVGQVSTDVLLSRITDAIRVLANKGNFDLHVGYVDICTTSDGQTLTLPRDIDTPLMVNIGGGPAFFRNRWFEFHLNGPGSMRTVPWTWDDRGWFCTAMDIINPSKLVAVADLKTDLRGTIRIFGYDSNGVWIRTQDANGVWADGFLLPINMISDYASGVVTVDDNRVFNRFFKTGEINKITSVNHQMVSGESGVLSLASAPLPAPLKVGTAYYVRVIDADNIALHATRTGALTGTGTIIITSASNLSQVALKDSRAIAVQTQFTSAQTHNMKTGQLVFFTATTIPSPLVANTDYYARVIDANNFTVHESADEAEANANPIDVTTPGAAVIANAKQDLKPITKLVFALNHNFKQGDAITIQNGTGTFPEPLLPNVFYYVHYINTKAITLHATLADATNNVSPIIITSQGSGTSVAVKTLAASASLGTSNNITCIGHGLSLNGGEFVQFATSGQFPTPLAQNTTYRADTPSSVDGFTVRTTAPDVINILTIGTGQLYAIISRAFTIGFTSQWQTDATEITTGGTVRFNTDGALPAAAPAVDTATDYYVRKISDTIVELYTSNTYVSDTVQRVVSSRARSVNVATIIFAANHGFTNGDFIDVSNVAINVTGILTGVTISAGGAGYTNGEQALITQSGRTAQGTLVVAAGAVTFVILSDGGTGFTAAVAVTITGLTSGAVGATATATAVATTAGLASVVNGALVTVSITSGGTAYVNGEAATIKNTSGNTATGTLAVTAGAITAITFVTRGSGFTTLEPLTVTGGTSGSTNAVVKVNQVTTNALQPDSTYNGERKQLTVVNLTTITYASTGLNEPATVDTGFAVRSDIKVTGLGAGSLFLSFLRAVTATPFSSLLKISDPEFLQDLATIRLETTGTLPAPLAVATDYHLSIEDGGLRIKDVTDVNIVLTNIGSGTHSMFISRTFSVTLPTFLSVPNNNYNDGDAITLTTTGILPTGLSLATTYYLRRVDDNSVEIYDTAAHATNLASTTGRITPTNTGTGVHTIVQVLANFDVKRIDRVAKSLTDGNIKVYAFDTGRTMDLTIIGDYFPDELEPIYRRIKIGSGGTINCPSTSWVRMRYRKTLFKLRSVEDFIPIRSRVAILMTLQALNLFRGEFNEGAKAILAQAVEFMNDEQISSDGADVIFLQVNDDIFTNPDGQQMQ